MTLLLALAFALSPQSRITLEGDSNLHRWTCAARVDPASMVELDKASPVLVTAAHIIVATAAIECGNGTMNGKLRDALRTKSIEFRFVRATRLPGEGVRLRVEGTLTIAGTTKSVAADVDTDGEGLAMGSFELKMTDFGVEPPTAVLGTLKTKDSVVVKVELPLGEKR